MAINDALALNELSNRDGKISLYWAAQDNVTVKAYKIYASATHANGAPTLVATIPNIKGDSFSPWNGSVGYTMLRSALATLLSVAADSAMYFKITTLARSNGSESTKADSPERLVISPTIGVPPTISLTDVPMTFSLGFTTSNLVVKNTGASPALLYIGRQTIQVDNGTTYDGKGVVASVIKAYCNTGQTATIQVSGGYLLF